jgi:asparagine synthase (glutamine-hydrolysing)
MAHSLEARVPLTDLELTGFLRGLPARLKLRGLSQKRLMRLAMKDVLPPVIVNKKKVGLEMPCSRWLIDELRDLVSTHLDGSSIADSRLFRVEAADRLVREHVTGRHATVARCGD